MAGRRKVVKDLLLSDDVQAQVELLLNLVSAAAGGVDVSRDVSEVIQVTIAAGVGHPTVKKLAFELCQAVVLSDSDYGLVVDGIRGGISSGVPELQAVALNYIPHLPPQHMVDLVDKGHVVQFLVPHTCSTTPAVRSAATAALCSLLLVPEVQAQLAASPALSSKSIEWWDAVADGVGDSMADVILTSVACVNKMFAAAEPHGSAGGSSDVAGLVRAAGRAAQRLCVGLGPLLDTWRMLPSHAQVPVIQLLGHLTRHLLAHAEGSQEPDFIGSGTRLPESTTGSYAAALPAIINYLTNSLNSLNAAVKLEAGKVLLRLATSGSKLPALSRLRVCAAVPPSTSAAAIEVLLELKDMLLVEPGLEEVVSLVASHLDSLQVSTRLKVLQRMWGLIALLQSPTDRMTALAAVWRTALGLHMATMQARTQGEVPAAEGATLDAILSDPFISDLIGDRPGQVSGVLSPGFTSPRTSIGGATALRSSPGGAAAAAGPAGGVARAATPAAGPTGASAYGSASPAAAAAATGAAGPGTPEPGVPSRPAPMAAGSPGQPGPAGGVSAAEAFGLGDRPGRSASGRALRLPYVSSSSSTRLIKTASQKITSSARAATDALTTASEGAKSFVANTAGAVMSRLLDEGGPVRPHLPPTLKQELVCTLLEVLAAHPSGELAKQLPAAPPHIHTVPAPAAAATNGTASSGAAPATGTSSPDKAAAAAAPAPAAALPKPPQVNSGPSGVTNLSKEQRDALAALFGGEPSTPPAASSTAGGGSAPPAASSSAAAPEAAPTPAPGAAATAAAAPAVLPQPPLPPKVWTKEDLAAQPSVAEVQARAVLWLGAAVTVLQHTKACLYWEPLVAPPMPGQPPSPALPPLQSVNLTTVPVDKWLQVLQSACHAVRAVLRVHGHEELRSVYRANAGRMLQQLSPWDTSSYLAKSLEGSAVNLQQVLQRELTQWKTLALAVRPRVLWVVAHYLELPAMLEETWSSLLVALEDVLLRLHRLEADAHARQLAMSARDGVLLKKFPLTQLQGPVAKASGGKTPFDAAAASALVELPEYRADGLQVGITVLQYLVWVVQSNVLRSGGGVAGQAEANLARRLQDIARAVTASETVGVDLKEWCRRISRVLNAILSPAAAGNAPANLPPGTGASVAAVAAAPPKKVNAATSLTGGYNAAAGFAAFDLAGARSSSSGSSGSSESGSDSEDDSSGSSSGSGSSSSSDDSDSDAASTADSDDSDATGAGAMPAQPPAAVLAAAAAAAAAAGGGAAAAAKKGKKKKKDKAQGADPNTIIGCPEASSGAWGYPFTGPRLQTMFISRRGHRHRLLRWQLAAAMTNARQAAAEDDPFAAAALDSSRAGGALDGTGPVFSAGSGFRLDKPSFWDSLPGSGSSWAELTGPNDPVVLSGRYTLSGLGGQELLLTLKAYNRLQMDLEGVQVVIRLVGPIRAEQRDVVWSLPRLLPTEAAQHTLKLIPSGYGLMQVHCQLLLPLDQLRSESGFLPALACQPLSISLARVLRPLESPPRGLESFLHTWNTLPLRAEVSATCCWPEVDGQLLALSALARQPLTCCWVSAVPVVGGIQAAYVACLAASPKDMLAVFLVGQLLPDGDGDDVLPAAADGEEEEEEEGEGSSPDQPSTTAAAATAAGGASNGRAVVAASGSNGNSGSSSSGGPKMEAQASEPWRQRMRGVVQLLVRTSSHEVMLVLKEHAALWVQDLSKGTLSLGVVPPAAASWDKPLLHPAVAQLEPAFGPAAAALPPPPAVPAPKMPPLPKFRRKLRDKADEEDSDAEDEELPPTPEEEARERAARAKHAEECEQVKERHHQALQKRAAAVLHHAALSEWHRLALA